MSSFNCITLLGHSGIGKTTLSALLEKKGWYHYCGDYRIATHYLNEAISDWLMTLALEQPLLAGLIADDALRIQGRVRIDHLRVLSEYIGKLGRNALDYATFTARQKAFAEAEKKAMYDIVRFKKLAMQRLGYPCFINDAGGSLGEYGEDTELMSFLAEETLIVYLHADDEIQAELSERAVNAPKPICYDRAFLERMIARYCKTSDVKSPDRFDCDDFLRFITPHLLRHRRQRYMRISARYGVCLQAGEVCQVRSAAQFSDLLDQAFREQRG